MTQLELLLKLLGAELEVDFIPIAQQALAILAKNPTALGLAAARLYVLSAVPAEALAAEQQLGMTVVGTVNSDLQKWFAAAEAKIAGVLPAAKA